MENRHCCDGTDGSPKRKGSLDSGSRIRGCLLGVAIGDALGAPFEHLGPGQTTPLLNASEGLIKDFHPSPGAPVGAWTDDTGMTLATCRGLLKAEKSGGDILTAIRQAFADWAGGPECRKPGKAVLHAAKSGRADALSWASGALMRMSPVGLYAFLKCMNRQEALSMAYRVARLTHGHPLATYPAVAMVRAIVSILQGDRMVPGFSGVGLSCGEAVLKDHASRIHHYHREYKPKYLGPLEALPVTTGLWMWRQVVEVCLGFVPNNPWVLGERGPEWRDLPGFKEGVLRTVNCSFDRDTAGAVAGALLGTYWGESGIPLEWRKAVENADRITALADELIEACQPVKREVPPPTKNGPTIGWGHGTKLTTDREEIRDDGTIAKRQPPGVNVRMEYELTNGIESEPGWEPLYWEDRYTLKCGDVVRTYVRPYMDPHDVFFREYRIQSTPYTFICSYYRVRGARVERVDLADDRKTSLKDLFKGAEVWIMRVNKEGNER